MFKEYLGESVDIFSAIGALATGVIAVKVAVEVFRFIAAHFLARSLGLSANIKSAGSWAVVTGCTDGIGKAYAEQLASKGLNIVLISRTQAKLDELSESIQSRYKVETRIIVADFSREDIYENLKNKLAGLDFAILINNVGCSYDHPEYYAEIDSPDFILRMIHMNCVSVAKMTEIVLPAMLAKRKGYIVNIGSSAGSAPVPFLALYSGTKAFVDLFTRSLQEEYGNKGVTFQIVIPYFVVSKLSKFRKPTTFIPTPSTFVKSAISTLGVQSRTTGYWAHELQDYYVGLIPMSIKKSLLLQSRARALKKKESVGKDQ